MKCPNGFECYVCKKSFHKINDENWSDEDAMEEYKRDFSGKLHEPVVMVCGYCYEMVKPSANPEYYKKYMESK